MKKNIIISLFIIVLFLFYLALATNISYFDNMLEEYVSSEVGSVRTSRSTKETTEKKTTTKKKEKTTTKTTSTTTTTTTTTKKTTTTVVTTITTEPIVITKPHKVSTSRYLVGKWTNTTNNIKLTYTFLPNGTYYINKKTKTKYEYNKATINGNIYIVSDNKLIIIEHDNYQTIRRVFIKNN